MANKSFEQILQELAAPFPSLAVQWRPGATNQDKTRAQALAYVDLRHYMERLDAVAPDWQSEVQPLGNGQVLVRLTVAGVTRTDVGEADPQDANTLTSAFAQAFKRACAQFGLGRYLYRLPKVWVAYDPDRRVLLEIPQLPAWALPEAERKARQQHDPAPQPQTQTTAQTTAQQSRSAPPQTAPKRATQAQRGDGNGGDRNRKGGGPASVVLKFGKYRGKTLGEVLEQDKGYLEWLVAKSNNQFIVEKARQLLQSQNGQLQTAQHPPESAFDDDIPF